MSCKKRSHIVQGFQKLTLLMFICISGSTIAATHTSQFRHEHPITGASLNIPYSPYHQAFQELNGNRIIVFHNHKNKKESIQLNKINEQGVTLWSLDLDIYTMGYHFKIVSTDGSIILVGHPDERGNSLATQNHLKIMKISSSGTILINKSIHATNLLPTDNRSSRHQVKKENVHQLVINPAGNIEILGISYRGTINQINKKTTIFEVMLDSNLNVLNRKNINLPFSLNDYGLGFSTEITQMLKASDNSYLVPRIISEFPGKHILYSFNQNGSLRWQVELAPPYFVTGRELNLHETLPGMIQVLLTVEDPRRTQFVRLRVLDLNHGNDISNYNILPVDYSTPFPTDRFIRSSLVKRNGHLVVGVHKDSGRSTDEGAEVLCVDMNGILLEKYDFKFIRDQYDEIISITEDKSGDLLLNLVYRKSPTSNIKVSEVFKLKDFCK